MWWILLGLLLLFFAVIIVRTLLFTPHKNVKADETEISFDGDIAVERLRELIKYKTVSYRDSSLEDEQEFEGFVNRLPALYPNVYSKCSLIKLPDRALLYKWEGKNHDEPAVMMAHYDVVPANEEDWDKPAFEAVLEDGVLWGRGSLDTKVTFNAVMSAAEHLIEKGFVPQNDIYFAFSGGEEVNGNGAVHIVDYFENNGLVPSFVIDEGGAVVENVFPGVKGSCGLIGIAEKGMMDVKYTVKSGGGHASAPKPGSPVPVLARACCTLENSPFKMHLTEPVAKMFDTLGRHSGFVYRMIFANLWLFKPVLDIMGKRSGGEINALLRTTVAFTQMNGSKASNVLPPEASLITNIRLNPKDTMESALKYIGNTVFDERVDIEVLHGMDPSRISRTDCPEWDKVAEAVASTWKGCIVSPYLMVQCSDSRHWGRISDKVYRFSAMDLSSEERATIHGNNERVRVQTVKSSVEFYIRLMQKC